MLLTTLKQCSVYDSYNMVSLWARSLEHGETIWSMPWRELESEIQYWRPLCHQCFSTVYFLKCHCHQWEAWNRTPLIAGAHLICTYNYSDVLLDINFHKFTIMPTYAALLCCQCQGIMVYAMSCAMPSGLIIMDIITTVSFPMSFTPSFFNRWCTLFSNVNKQLCQTNAQTENQTFTFHQSVVEQILESQKT